MESGQKIHKGQLLYASPFQFELIFNRSVIMLAEHNEVGSTGFIINKKLELNVDELIADKIHTEIPVYWGGPVGQDELYYIHNKGDEIPGSRSIAGGISWGGKFDVIRDMINEGNILSEDIRFFIGYAGWSANQLSEELEMQAWIQANESLENALQVEDLWQNKMHKMGGRFSLWAGFPPGPWPN
ncbi:MAG: YqgE/AlgH family protein [Candidatus Competibacteraceae bacterium]|nr:YqgE/AlgH family protein [Candidatus Competibacteraceae bacterium]